MRRIKQAYFKVLLWDTRVTGKRLQSNRWVGRVGEIAEGGG
jgi:hypothetical protein